MLCAADFYSRVLFYSQLWVNLLKCLLSLRVRNFYYIFLYILRIYRFTLTYIAQLNVKSEWKEKNSFYYIMYWEKLNPVCDFDRQKCEQCKGSLSFRNDGFVQQITSELCFVRKLYFFFFICFFVFIFNIK